MLIRPFIAKYGGTNSFCSPENQPNVSWDSEVIKSGSACEDPNEPVMDDLVVPTERDALAVAPLADVRVELREHLLRGNRVVEPTRLRVAGLCCDQRWNGDLGSGSPVVLQYSRGLRGALRPGGDRP